MTIKYRKTERGFVIGEFTDLYDKNCSIQESSLATKEAIWLGVHGERMHLDKKLATELFVALGYFLHHGHLQAFPIIENIKEN